MPYKVREIFDAELQVVADTGRCPPILYLFLLLWRARLPCETQEVEGLNSIIQFMTQSAPRPLLFLASYFTLKMAAIQTKTITMITIPGSKLALITDRLRNKVGDNMTADEASSIHTFVLAHMTSPSYLYRFLAPDKSGVPPEEEPPSLSESSEDKIKRWALARRFERSLLLQIQVEPKLRLRYVWSFSSLKEMREVQAFLMCWPFNKGMFVAMGRLVQGAGRCHFDLQRPSRNK